MKKNLTELVFVVDRSGSMAGLESDTIGGLNATLQRNREIEGECIVSIVLFDDSSKVLVDRKPIDEVADLAKAQYQVRGCTALLDAVGDAVRYHEKVQQILPEDYRAENVIFTIITDGMENASRRRTYHEVKRMLEAKQEQGWEFLFLGANIDAAAEAGRMGIRPDRASEYVSDGTGTAIAYEAMACAQVDRRMHGQVSPTWNDAPMADARARGGRHAHGFKFWKH
ncbi:MAG: VWA domain-containing protein [Atopobiaceae bacterium]|nr:VWA domain-containing protein [Atopobiaceae bacterium]